MSRDQVRKSISSIEGGRLKPSLKTDREHLAHVKKIIETKSADKSCPKCGSKMVLREAKRGANAGNQFWGCSAFPKCRGVVNVN